MKLNTILIVLALAYIFALLQVTVSLPTMIEQTQAAKNFSLSSGNSTVATVASKPRHVFCLNQKTKDGSMTLADLRGMINTVDIVFDSLALTNNTYIATNYGQGIFENSDHAQAYFQLFGIVNKPKPHEIWMTQSPCPACAKRLISEYGKPESIKPILHIASIYTGNNLLDTVDSMKCMAKMVHLNFTILPWDWTEFRDNIDHSDCINSIDAALQHSGFIKKQMVLRSLLGFICELALNPQVSDWCNVPS